MLEGIVEQNQGLVVGLQHLHVVDALFPRLEVLGVAFEELNQTGVCIFMAFHLFQDGGHHQQGVFVVGVQQQGLGKVLQCRCVVLSEVIQHAQSDMASKKWASSSKHCM